MCVEFFWEYIRSLWQLRRASPLQAPKCRSVPEYALWRFIWRSPSGNSLIRCQELSPVDSSSRRWGGVGPVRPGWVSSDRDSVRIPVQFPYRAFKGDLQLGFKKYYLVVLWFLLWKPGKHLSCPQKLLPFNYCDIWGVHKPFAYPSPYTCPKVLLWIKASSFFQLPDHMKYIL